MRWSKSRIKVCTWKFWLSICVETSIPESQQPYPGWEWYQPMAFSRRPTLQRNPGWNLVNRHYNSYLFCRLNVCGHVLVALRLRVHSSLCALHRKGKRVHHHHDIGIHLNKLMFDGWCSPVAIMLYTPTFPNSSPMISRLPPDLACITIFSSAKAEILISWRGKSKPRYWQPPVHLEEVGIFIPWFGSK